VSTLRSARLTLEMIKWEHSIFALPFALTGAVLAGNGWPPWRVIVLVIVCMVAARSAGMAFNRLVDAEIDGRNPRTAARALPAGLLGRGFVRLFIAVSCTVFLLAAWRLNPLTFALSPVALALVLAYSYTKRFTRWSHLVLGLVLGIAPAAAWIAVRGSLSAPILVLTAAVMCWVAGFDVLYACQDCEFDREAKLHSIPSAIGVGRAFWVARTLHLLALILLGALVPLFGLGPIAITGIAIVGLLLIYEHTLVSPGNLARLNAAFFTMNGLISVVFFLFLAADVFRRARH
jgi:4-hydroxybenzoate polyprenyltransferase